MIERVLEQTGNSRQKILSFKYFNLYALLETVELQYYKTLENQIQSDRTYLVYGAALLKDGIKPKINLYFLDQAGPWTIYHKIIKHYKNLKPRVRYTTADPWE